MQSSFRATLMSADTGGSQVYEFKADSGLFRKPARHIVREFMNLMKAEKNWTHPISYKLNSATKKSSKEIVMATGALVLEKGELPFLVMISPEVRATTADQQA